MRTHPTLALLVVLAACSDGGISDHSTPVTSTTPMVSNLAVAENPLNALALVATFDARGVDSARLLLTGGTAGPLLTPAARVVAATVRVVALGLEPSTHYVVSVEGFGAAGTVAVTSAAVEASTGEPPEPLRSLRLEATGTPHPGYTLVTPIFLGGDSIGYVTAFDGAGRLAWYRAFRGEGWAMEAKQHPNDNFTVSLSRSYGWQPTAARFVEFQPDGEIVRDYRAYGSQYTDPHEIQLTFAPSIRTPSAVWLLNYSLQPFDLRALGGGPAQPLAVHGVEGQNGQFADFRWSAEDWYTPADWARPSATNPDVVHPSSFDLDPRGGVVVAFQALDQIAKIDQFDYGFYIPAVSWRLGGKHSDFAIAGDPLGGFHGPHGVRLLPDGHLLFFDNQIGTAPMQSRAVEYQLDFNTHTANLVWEYRPSPPIASPIMGSVQRLRNGNTVVGFGVAGRVVEVTPGGSERWSATLRLTGSTAPVPFYRAIRIGSLERWTRP